MCEEGWQPIETAPKNRTVLLFYRNEIGNGRTIRGYYVNPRTVELDDPTTADDYDEQEMCGWLTEGWYEEAVNSENLFSLEAPPTHWMPLPSPPGETAHAPEPVASSATVMVSCPSVSSADVSCPASSALAASGEIAELVTFLRAVADGCDYSHEPAERARRFRRAAELLASHRPAY